MNFQGTVQVFDLNLLFFSSEQPGFYPDFLDGILGI